MCGKDGRWFEPDGLQECYDANVNERFGEIMILLNQVSNNCTNAAKPSKYFMACLLVPSFGCVSVVRPWQRFPANPDLLG